MRIVALVLKELRQHVATLLVLVLFLGITWASLALGVILAPDTVTWLEVHAELMRVFAPVAALALGNRLVVSEYHARTQVFLEALPLRRVEMLVVKLVIGLVVLGGVSAASLLVTIVLASMREPIDALFASIIAARTAVFIVFLWAWFFAMGFLGRLRAAVYVVTLLGFLVVAGLTELEVAHFGPIELVGPQMPLEREEMPWEALGVTAGLAGFWLLLAFVLGTWREGSFAESLSRRMTQRERVTVGVLVIAGLVALAEVDPPNQRPPFAFPEAQVLRSESPPLEIFHVTEEALPDAQRLADRLRPALRSLASDLGWDAPPMTRVALREALDGTTFEPVEVGDDDGVLLRANFRASDDWSEEAFVAEVLARVIDDPTDGRSDIEALAAARDGFATHRAPGVGELPARLAARALAGMRGREPSYALLARWDLLAEEEGEDTARAIAATWWRALATARGEDASNAAARALFHDTPSRTLMPVLALRSRPVSRVIEEEAGLAPAALDAAWAESLRALAARSDVAMLLAQIPEGSGEIEIVSDGGAHDLVARARLAAPAPEGSVLSVGHFPVGPHDTRVSRWDEQRDDTSWPEGQREAVIRLLGRYASGDRVRVVLDVSSPAIGGTLRLAATRLEVP